MSRHDLAHVVMYNPIPIARYDPIHVVKHDLTHVMLCLPCCCSTGPGRGSSGWTRGGGRGSGRGRGQGKGRGEPISAATLDADLDKYHAVAMQTN
ncbi:hypothetical protein GW17_00000325 [Ensete ventricosum]|nr:hypothetical protein GW17_00000325 [Ensete ventricosum]